MTELTLALLDDLGARWRRAGAPVADALRPGVSEGEAAALTKPAGCMLPPEARTWWSWHNGTTVATAEYEAWPGKWLVALKESVETSRSEWNEFVAIVGEEEARAIWRPTWLPILTTGGGDHVVIDCAEQARASPVYFFDREGGGPWTFTPHAPSIGMMVTWWIEGIDNGACWWDRARRRWMKDYPRLDPDNTRRGLV